MKGLKITTRKIGAGHFNVTVIKYYKEIGVFETTDMQLIDDVNEMINDGFENELMIHDTFEEVIETCLEKL